MKCWALAEWRSGCCCCCLWRLARRKSEKGRGGRRMQITNKSGRGSSSSCCCCCCCCYCLCERSVILTVLLALLLVLPGGVSLLPSLTTTEASRAGRGEGWMEGLNTFYCYCWCCCMRRWCEVGPRRGLWSGGQGNGRVAGVVLAAGVGYRGESPVSFHPHQCLQLLPLLLLLILLFFFSFFSWLCVRCVADVELGAGALDGCDDDDEFAVYLVYGQSGNYSFLVGALYCLRLKWYQFERASNVYGKVRVGSSLV